MSMVVALLAGALAITAFTRTDTRRHVIEMRDFVFAPIAVEATVGDTVTWINHDVAPHTATSLRAQFDSGNMPKGKRWSWVPSSPGRFEYVCAYHPSMRGTVTVRRRP